jgi:hypothetical protein
MFPAVTSSARKTYAEAVNASTKSDDTGLEMLPQVFEKISSSFLRPRNAARV